MGSKQLANWRGLCCRVPCYTCDGFDSLVSCIVLVSSIVMVSCIVTVSDEILFSFIQGHLSSTVFIIIIICLSMQRTFNNNNIKFR